MRVPVWLHSILEHDRDPALDEMRWRLHRRLLLVTSVLSLGFALQGLTGKGAADMWVAFAATLAAALALKRWPSINRPLALGMLGLFLVIGASSVLGAKAGFPTALMPMMVFPVFAAVLTGFWPGLLVTLAVAGAAAGVLLRTQQTAIESLFTWFTLISAGGLLACCLNQAWSLAGLLELRRSGAASLGAIAASAEELAQALGKGVLERIRDLERSLEDLSEFGGTLDALEEELRRARRSLPKDLAGPLESPEELDQRLCAASLGAFLKVALALSLGGWLLVTFMGLDQAEVGLATAAAIGVLTALRSRGWISWVACSRLLLAACLGAVYSDLRLSVGTNDAGSLIFLPLIVFFAGLLDSLVVALLVALAAVAMLWWGSLSYPASALSGGGFYDLAMLTAAMLAVNAALRMERRRLLGAMLSQDSALRLSLARCRRLASSLFHDLANPLAVLKVLRSAGPPKGEEALRAGRMLGRMQAVALAALQVDAGGQPVPTETYSVAELCAQLKDLFGERFRAKQVDCSFDAPQGMLLPPSSALLRDSVLANLVSNALKYSPPGATVRLLAAEAPGGLTLKLRDQGPGFPAEVLKALDADQAPPSRPGSQGEPGSGYGLLLAKAYLHRQGGRLSLRNLEGGGAEAEVWLPA